MKTLYISPAAELLSFAQEDILTGSNDTLAPFDNIVGDDFDLLNVE